MAERVVHLFDGREEGGEIVLASHITLCCKRYAIDMRVASGEGTVNPDAATCVGDDERLRMNDLDTEQTLDRMAITDRGRFSDEKGATQ